MGDYDLSFNVGVGGTTLDGSVYVREQTGGCTTYAPGLKVSDFPSMPMPTTTKNLIAEIGKRVKHGEILQTSHGRGKHGIPQHRLSGIGRNRIRRIAWLDCGRASIEQRLQQVAAKLGQLESRRNMFVHLVGGNLLKQSCHFETNSNFL